MEFDAYKEPSELMEEIPELYIQPTQGQPFQQASVQLDFSIERSPSRESEYEYEPILPKQLPNHSTYVQPAMPRESDSDIESSHANPSDMSDKEFFAYQMRQSRAHMLREIPPALTHELAEKNYLAALTVEDEIRLSPQRKSWRSPSRNE